MNHRAHAWHKLANGRQVQKICYVNGKQRFGIFDPIGGEDLKRLALEFAQEVLSEYPGCAGDKKLEVGVCHQAGNLVLPEPRCQGMGAA